MSITPVSVKRIDSVLKIEWKDGHRTEIGLADLRRNCPCAECRKTPPKVVEANDPLKLFDDQPIALVGASLVGNYAIQFNWNDGHSHGIYSFDFLRSLCKCSNCTAPAGDGFTR
ncbi:MAG: DUF971 domain-containing protein [Acidobacteriota bacterium]|nr:MAG: DUF971 domain-containing protein [Acidobacteriota bacterium]